MDLHFEGLFMQYFQICPSITGRSLVRFLTPPLLVFLYVCSVLFEFECVPVCLCVCL